MDLSTAGLIDGSFTAGSPTTSFGINLTESSTPSLQQVYPRGKIGGLNYISVWSGGYNNQDNTNYFGLSGFNYSGGQHKGTPTKQMTAIQAYHIDSKVDDGLPQSGSVMAIVQGQDWAGTSQGTDCGPTLGIAVPFLTVYCYDNGNNAAATMQYSVESTSGNPLACDLSFKFQ